MVILEIPYGYIRDSLCFYWRFLMVVLEIPYGYVRVKIKKAS